MRWGGEQRRKAQYRDPIEREHRSSTIIRTTGLSLPTCIRVILTAIDQCRVTVNPWDICVTKPKSWGKQPHPVLHRQILYCSVANFHRSHQASQDISSVDRSSMTSISGRGQPSVRHFSPRAGPRARQLLPQEFPRCRPWMATLT